MEVETYATLILGEGNELNCLQKQILENFEVSKFQERQQLPQVVTISGKRREGRGSALAIIALAQLLGTEDSNIQIVCQSKDQVEKLAQLVCSKVGEIERSLQGSSLVLSNDSKRSSITLVPPSCMFSKDIHIMDYHGTEILKINCETPFV